MSSDLGGAALREKNKKMSPRPSDYWRIWDPGFHIHIVRGFRGQSTVLCGSCGFNIKDAHTESFTRSILRVGILLIGGDKTGDDRWYDRYVPIADRLYEEHLIAVEKEESRDG